MIHTCTHKFQFTQCSVFIQKIGCAQARFWYYFTIYLLNPSQTVFLTILQQLTPPDKAVHSIVTATDSSCSVLLLAS